jgi:Tol biopolymer transport system component
LPLLAVGSGTGAVAGTVSPPQNGLIAVSGMDGVLLVDPRDSAMRKVPGTAELENPVWSPEGSLLAAEGWGEAEVSSVYTFRPDGTERQLVLSNAWSPSWSPDGKRLLVLRDSCRDPYDCASESSVLATVRADGSDMSEIPLDPAVVDGGPGEPTWSPDGEWIVFGHEGAILLVSLDGQTVRTVADSGYDFAWSPDGSKLAFITYDEKNDFRQQFVVLAVATGARTTLPIPPRKTISRPAWSPNGKRLAYLQSRDAMPKSDGHGCGGEMPMDLWAMNADGTGAHQISKGQSIWGKPVWGTFRPEPVASD